MQNTRVELKYWLLMGLIVVAIAGLWHLNMNAGDVKFCQRVFQGLANGSASVQRAIDWEQFRAMGVDVGSTYRQLGSARDRATYRNQLIKHLAEGFRQAGGDVKSFKRWRVAGTENGLVLVAVASPEDTDILVFAVPASGKRRVVSIQWAL